jgi:hypothetical protein
MSGKMKQHPICKLYYITEDGQVWSTLRKKWLKPEVSHNGYYRYTLSINGKFNKFFAHRLVADCYLSKPDEDRVINHIDKNRTNNHYKNLEWVTVQYNVHYSHSKKYLLEEIETGEKIEVYNLNAWCKEKNLNQGNLSASMSRGGTSQGYKVTLI